MTTTLDTSTIERKSLNSNTGNGRKLTKIDLASRRYSKPPNTSGDNTNNDINTLDDSTT